MAHMVLTNHLRQLPASGGQGFEGLILQLIEDLTGYPLHLARSGDQNGRDMRSARTAGSVIAIECKRYGTDTELDKTELLGKLVDAKTTTGMSLGLLKFSGGSVDDYAICRSS